MANGFSLGLLQFQKELSKDATPQYKVEPYGFLASLYGAHSRGVIKNDSYNGHFKTVQVKSKQRFTPAQTSDDPTGVCERTNLQPTNERTVSIANHRNIAIYMEDEVVAAFDDYASNPSSVGSPGISLMEEHLDSVATAASAILSAVNTDLVTLAATAVGVNRTTGVATAKTLNFNDDTNVNLLTEGLTLLYSDFKKNTMMGRPIVVGSGLFHAFMVQQAAKGNDQAGINTRIQAAGLDFWYDDTVGVVKSAANNILVYEKDAVQIVEYLKFQGFKAGQKPGASSFGTLMLPMQVGDQLLPVEFDYQLRYSDCEQTLFVDGEDPQYGGTTVQKGYNLILSKNFGLDTIPSTAYRSGDVLEGNRGSLLYNVTNS